MPQTSFGTDLTGQEKMRKNIVILVLSFLLAILLIVVFYQNKADEKLNNQPNGFQEILKPEANNPVPSPNPSVEDGGDRDEFGCIPSAGYSWCEEKQKCLREWEEACEESEEDIIAQVLADKHNAPVEEISIRITQREGDYARGGVEFVPGGPGNAGMFLVTKEKGQWEIAFDGNGNPDCLSLKQNYNFPETILAGFCD